MANILFDIGAVIIVATLFAFFAKLLRQPLIPAYILAGVLIGPFLGLITNSDIISTLSEIGIAFLLFIVGLEIDLRKLKHFGIVASFGGVIQVVGTAAIAFIICLILGFFVLESVYIALIIAFSSTMIVVKLLSDKREIDTLHGKIIIGILLVQDIIAIIALSVMTTLNTFSFLALAFSLLKGILVLLAAIVISKYFLPSIFGFAAKSQELLFISAVSLSFFYSLIFNYIGFSIAIGAFVAGISLANLPYNIEIIGKIKSLRDFFSVMFFVSLGMQLLPGKFETFIIPLMVLLIVVVLIKPLITMFTTSFFGYKKRTAFLTSISLAQISEFSLIIAAQGLLLGHISNELFSMTVMLAIITITLATYFINFENSIYSKISGFLDFFDMFAKNKFDFEHVPKNKKAEIIVCGHNRIGFGIVKTLKKMKKNILVVDFNPDIIKGLMRENIPCLYGDIGDLEVLERLDFKSAKMVISTIPTKIDNMLLVKTAKKESKKVIVLATATQINEALELYDCGVDYVVMPHFLGSEHLSVLIEKFTGSINKLVEHKVRHINELKERHAIGHEHPVHQ